MNPDKNKRIRFRHPDALDQSSGASEPVEQPQYSVKRSAKIYAPRPPHKHLLRRFIVFLLVVSVVAALVYGAYIVSIVAKISTNSWQFGPLLADSSGRTNVLVLGVGDPGHAGEQLTDTMMLLSLDAGTQKAAQVSLPRDTRVQIPGFGFSKINAANAYGGVNLAEQTVSNTLEIPIHYYLKTNFSGLKNLVDAVGGVDVDVKERLRDPEYPCDADQTKSCGLDIRAGIQHMDGTTALQYVRCRKGTCGNDFGRAARQQELIRLLKPKVIDPHLLLHPMKLTKIVDAGQKGIQTDLGLIQLLSLATSLRSDGNQTNNLVLSTSPGGYLRSDPQGSSDLLPIGGDFSAISKRVKSIFQ